MSTHALVALGPLAVATSLVAQPAPVAAPRVLAEVTVRNDAPFARRELVEVASTRIPGLSKPADLERVHVTPAGAASEILAQAMDTDGDYDEDTLIFEANLPARGSARFQLSLGAERTLRKEDFRVYGRFVRERFDDFAWENDKVAFRVYGEALETWVREPLTSSGVDAWVKSTSRLTIDDWYLVDDYHEDHGEGGDFYPAGKSRGCGGSGLLNAGRLYTSKNFRTSRVLSRGPLRLLFELTYEAWDVAGAKVRETKRVTLDAGSHFSRFDSVYTTEDGAPLPESVLWAAGAKKEEGADVRIDARLGTVRTWEELNRYGKNGFMGCALVVDPKRLAQTPELDENVLLALRGPATYYAGTGWDRGGEFAGVADFDAYVEAFTRRLASPLRVEVGKPAYVQMADSVMARDPSPLTLDSQKPAWNYTQGLVLKGVLAVYERTGDERYLDYVTAYYDYFVNPDGSIKAYDIDEYSVDRINAGKLLFPLFAETKQEKYRKAIELLRLQMKNHPRTKEGGFWHKKRYPWQMWLDGLYMASPFLAEYAVTFREPELIDDVIDQFVWMERHARDPRTGLLYHGWDESREQKWADPETGLSKEFWGRAVGWYAMALVDVLDFIPKDHPRRGEIVAILERLAAALVEARDPETGVFWQVLDKPGQPGNYLESSASVMFAYALLKGARLGYLDRSYGPVGRSIYAGVMKEFVTVDGAGVMSIHKGCAVAGLGGDPNSGTWRSGTFDYYVREPVRSNDPKAVGPFILASLEMDSAAH